MAFSYFADMRIFGTLFSSVQSDIEARVISP